MEGSVAVEEAGSMTGTKRCEAARRMKTICPNGHVMSVAYLSTHLLVVDQIFSRRKRSDIARAAMRAAMMCWTPP